MDLYCDSYGIEPHWETDNDLTCNDVPEIVYQPCLDCNLSCQELVSRYTSIDPSVRGVGKGAIFKASQDVSGYTAPSSPSNNLNDDVISYSLSINTSGGSDYVERPNIGLSRKLLTFPITEVYPEDAQGYYDVLGNRHGSTVALYKGTETKERRVYAYLDIPQDGWYSFAIKANRSTNEPDPDYYYCQQGSRFCGGNGGIEVQHVRGNNDVACECSEWGMRTGHFECCKFSFGGEMTAWFGMTGEGTVAAPYVAQPPTLPVMEDNFASFNWKQVTIFSASAIAYDYAHSGGGSVNDGSRWSASRYYRAGSYPIQIGGDWFTVRDGGVLPSFMVYKPQFWWRRDSPDPLSEREYIPGTSGANLMSCVPSNLGSTCNLTIINLPASISVGSPQNFSVIASVVSPNSVPQSFASAVTGGTGSITITPASGAAWGASTKLFTLDNIVSTTAGETYTVTVTGNIGTNTCVATKNFTVTNVPAWFRIDGGDIVSSGTNANIKDSISGSLKLFGLDNFGLPIYSGNLLLNPGIISTNLSDTKYHVKAQVNQHLTPGGGLYNYSYYWSKFTPTDPNASIAGPDFGDIEMSFGGGQQKSGYTIFSKNGDLNLTGLNLETLSGSQKVIIFVDGEVDITGKIILRNGVDFLMIISTGDIKVSSSITHVVGNLLPDLEGIFVTDKVFSTGVANEQLFIRGMIIAYGDAGTNNGLSLQRDIADKNDSYPSEIFEFAPDQVLLFPSFFSQKSISWKEISP